MKDTKNICHTALRLLLAGLLVAAALPALRAEGATATAAAKKAEEAKAAAAAQDTEAKLRLDINGAAMLDMGYQSGSSDPNWFDVVRPTKLPAYEGQYGKDGRFFSGVRQSRLGSKPSCSASVRLVSLPSARRYTGAAPGSADSRTSPRCR